MVIKKAKKHANKDINYQGNIADLDPVGILFIKVCGLDCLTRSCYQTQLINWHLNKKAGTFREFSAQNISSEPYKKKRTKAFH